MFGWPELAAAVAKVYLSIPSERRAGCAILAQNCGEAGAIDYFGRQYGLPAALSGHQNYWLWGPRGYTGQCLIVVGFNQNELEQQFSEVLRAGETFQQYAIPHENHRAIWIVRGPKFGSLMQIWPKLKNWS
jgi:hypothetical protein